MPEFDWVKLLKSMVLTWIVGPGMVSDLLANWSVARKWAGFPPATYDAITATETRLQRWPP